MSIGKALAGARDQAGLTVSEVSAVTRIRESIVRDIERGHFESCGGDFYARGHVRAIAQAVGTDARPLIEEFDAARRAEQQAADAQAEDSPPMRLREPRLRGERPGVNWTAVLAVLVVVALGFAGYLLVAGSGGSGRAGKPGVDAARSAHRGAGHGPGHRASPQPTASAPSPVLAKSRVLTPVSAVAFGPAGLGSGDEPQEAALAIDGNPSTAWHSDWYATSEFGALQEGTGLLIDLGRPVTITSARLALGDVHGASVQLRAGDTPEPDALTTVASTTDAGGVAAMRVGSPVQARYLLVWFTKLPADQAGTFMASVYSLSLDGLPGASGQGAG